MHQDNEFIETCLREHMTADFLRNVLLRHHYTERDMKTAIQVTKKMWQSLEHQEGFFCLLPKEPERKEGSATGILTLGTKLDCLEEHYVETEKLEEAYLLEVLSWELLREGYVVFRDWVAANTDWNVVSFAFYGSDENLPLAALPALLEQTKTTEITCNEAYCLQPKKSVVFLAKLSKDLQKDCDFHICGICNRTDCPSRREETD